MSSHPRIFGFSRERGILRLLLDQIINMNRTLGILKAGSKVEYRAGRLLLVFPIFAASISPVRYILWRGGFSGHNCGAMATLPLTTGT